VSHDVIHSADPSNLDEDLFDFAGVARDPGGSEPEEDLEEIFASFRDEPPAEELLAVPAAPVTAPAPAAPASATHRAAGDAQPQAPAPKSPARPAAAFPKIAPEPRAIEPLHELAPAARPSRFSKNAVAIALAVTVLNSGLALVMLRGRMNDGGARMPVGDVEPESREHDALAAPPHQVETSLPDPEAVEPSHGHPALDEARAQISRGEYAAARQRVYALLAIIDRLDDPRRSALEADCQFLVAQSLHLEALARMGGSE
jgi:hypothetical protein